MCRDYVALCNAMSNGDGKGWATRVSTEDELIQALKTATGEKANQYASIAMFPPAIFGRIVNCQLFHT